MPTDKQLAKFADLLDKRIATCDRLIAQATQQIEDFELTLKRKIETKSVLYEMLLAEVRRYSSEFCLGWDDGLESQLDQDQLSSKSTIRKLVRHEVNVQRGFDAERSRLLGDNLDGLQLLNKKLHELLELERSKQGKFFERRRIQNQIAVLKEEIADQEQKIAQIEATTIPQLSRIVDIQELLDKLDALKIADFKDAHSQLKDELLKLEIERKEAEIKRAGGNFESACAEWVESERAKRKLAEIERKRAEEEAEANRQREVLEAKKERERRAAERLRKKENKEKRERARVASLKAEFRKNEKFLEANPEISAKRRCEAAERTLRNLELQRSRAEEACIRKVKQMRLSAQRHLMPKCLDEEELITELKKRDWHQIPALDNLVARLREKTEDVSIAKKEADGARRLVDRIERAKAQVNEFRNTAHLLEANSGRGKSAPPRIPVENWEDAEELAVRYVKWLGFADARRTKTGSDEGKDVESARCVAQVKDLGTGATRPMLQQLFGVASAEKKIPIFFSRSYARPAMEWGETHGLALFRFDLRGTITPVSDAARKLVAK